MNCAVLYLVYRLYKKFLFLYRNLWNICESVKTLINYLGWNISNNMDCNKHWKWLRTKKEWTTD